MTLIYNTVFDVNTLQNLYPAMTLSVEIVSGQHIPRPNNSEDGEVIDPYIEVSRGH